VDELIATVITCTGSASSWRESTCEAYRRADNTYYCVVTLRGPGGVLDIAADDVTQGQVEEMQKMGVPPITLM
jgi:hypothetical protein